MKCKYTFKVAGNVRVAELHAIKARGWLFEFLEEDGRLAALTVTVPANGPNDLPIVTQNPAPGVKAHIHVPAPAFPFVAREVRAIEALLSVFGVHQIDLNRFTTKWIPENDQEKAAIKINDFSNSLSAPDLNALPPLPFDLLARSVFAADEAAEMEMQLTFFRKGGVDCYERRFIEAVYDFYFFLESLFGAGQFKKKAVQQAFMNSKPLTEAIQKVILDPESTVQAKGRELEEFIKKYGAMSVEDIVEHVVELRGFLHHHTGKRKGIWHPEDHRRYQLEALLLQSIAFSVAMETCLDYLDRPEVLENYARAFGRK